jgi:pectate lyase
LTEANVFFEVRDPIESRSYSNDQSVVVSRENLYIDVSGQTQDRGTDVFAPPYEYALDEVRSVKAAVESGAGVCPSRFVFTATPSVTCSASPGADVAATP